MRSTATGTPNRDDGEGASFPLAPSTLHFSELPDVLTVEEAAAILRLSRNGAYEAIQRREIPSIRIGKRVLVPKQRLLDLLGL